MITIILSTILYLSLNNFTDLPVGVSLIEKKGVNVI